MNDERFRPLVREQHPEDSLEAELAELLRARDPLPRLPAGTVARLRLAVSTGAAPSHLRPLLLGAVAAAALLAGAPLAAAWMRVWPHGLRGFVTPRHPAPTMVEAPLPRHLPVLEPPLAPPAPVSPAPQAPSTVNPLTQSLRERKPAFAVARAPIARMSARESPTVAAPAPAVISPAQVAPAMAAQERAVNRVPIEDAELVAEGEFLETLARPNLAPGEVLATLAQYRRRFPKQELGGQADFAELGARIALRQPAEALAVVERRETSADARLAELHVLHGELLGQLGRCAEALGPFDHELGASTELAERAWYGKASCLTRLGKALEARATLHGYLSRYPQGRFAAQARSLLNAQRPSRELE